MKIAIAPGTANGMQFTVSPYYECWAKLSLSVTGTAPQGLAQIQVQLTASNVRQLFLRNITLPGGQVHLIENFLLPITRTAYMLSFQQYNRYKCTISIVQNGQQTGAPLTFKPTFNPVNQHAVMVLAQNSAPLTAIQINLLAAQPLATGLQSEMVTAPDARDLPNSAEGYLAFSRIVLADQPLSSLTAMQISALQNYVYLGGTLIVSGGANLTHLQNPALQQMLPIKPQQVSTAHVLKFDALPKYAPLTSAAGFALTEGKLMPGAVVFASTHAGQPLISTISRGSGKVVFTSFDLLDSDLNRWPGRIALWKLLDTAGRHPVPILPRMPDIAAHSSYILNSLSGSKAASVPSIKVVAFFCIAYLLLISPVNYLILKKLDRLEWSWVTIPACILLFTAGAYLFGRILKNAPLTLRSITYLETTANSGHMAGTIFASIYSPRSSYYKVVLHVQNAFKNSFVPGIPRQPGNPYLIPPAHRSVFYYGAAHSSLQKLFVPVWTSHFIYQSFTIRSGGIHVQLAKISKNLFGFTITNKNSFPVEQCVLETHPLGTLQPGQSVTANFTSAQLAAIQHSDSAYSWHTAALAPVYPAGHPPAGFNLQAAAKHGINPQTVYNTDSVISNFARPYPALHFFAWLPKAVVQFDIPHSTVVSKQASLLIVHIPLSNFPAYMHHHSTGDG